MPIDNNTTLLNLRPDFVGVILQKMEEKDAPQWRDVERAAGVFREDRQSSKLGQAVWRMRTYGRASTEKGFLEGLEKWAGVPLRHPQNPIFNYERNKNRRPLHTRKPRKSKKKAADKTLRIEISKSGDHIDVDLVHESDIINLYEFGGSVTDAHETRDGAISFANRWARVIGCDVDNMLPTERWNSE
jgi:hypothetical protein